MLHYRRFFYIFQVKLAKWEKKLAGKCLAIQPEKAFQQFFTKRKRSFPANGTKNA